VISIGTLNEIISFLKLQDEDVPEIFTLESIDKIFHFIMLSKLKNPQIFTHDGWKETWNNWDSLSELDREYIIALRIVCQLFDDSNTTFIN